MQKSRRIFMERLKAKRCVLKNNNLKAVALVRERTKPTDRLLLVGEVSANFCGYRVSCGLSATDPHGRILGFLVKV
jgi:hypothetical protein